MESFKAVQKQKNKEETIWRLSESDCLMRCTRPTAGVFLEPQRETRSALGAGPTSRNRMSASVCLPSETARDQQSGGVGVVIKTCRVMFCQVWQQTAGAKRQVVEVHLASCEVNMVRCRMPDDIGSILSETLRPSLDRLKLGCRVKVWFVPNLLSMYIRDALAWSSQFNVQYKRRNYVQ